MKLAVLFWREKAGNFIDLMDIVGSTGRKRMKHVTTPATITAARKRVASKQEAKLLDDRLDLGW